MPNTKSKSVIKPGFSDSAPNWSELPDDPPTKWKESDYCRSAEIVQGEVLFQFRNETSEDPNLRDFVLLADGRLERIDVVETEKQLENRIRRIIAQNGEPDISTEALKQLRASSKHRQPRPSVHS